MDAKDAVAARVPSSSSLLFPLRLLSLIHLRQVALIFLFYFLGHLMYIYLSFRAKKYLMHFLHQTVSWISSKPFVIV